MFKDSNTISKYRPKIEKTELVTNPTMSSRLTGLDLARCFAMLMMILGHVFFELVDKSLISIDQFPWNFWEFTRGLTAPTFLIVSGIVQIFANKREKDGSVLKSTIRRRLTMGTILIAVGYLLVFPASNVLHIFAYGNHDFTNFFQVNILQLIGISLLILLAMFTFTKNNKQLGWLALIGAITINILTPFVLLADGYKYFPEFLAPYFSQKHGSIFPIFPFTSFLLWGAAFGSLIQSKAPDERYDFIKRIGLIAGIAFIAVGLPLYYYVETLNLHFIEPYKGNPGMSVIRIGAVLILLSLLMRLFLRTNQFSRFYSFFGKRALLIYVIHLMILYGTPWNLSIGQYYHQSLPILTSFLISLGILISTVIISWCYDYSVKKYESASKFYKYSLISLIVFMLFV